MLSGKPAIAGKRLLIGLQVGVLLHQSYRCCEGFPPFSEFLANRIRRSGQAFFARSSARRGAVDDRVRHVVDREQVIAKFPFPLRAETVKGYGQDTGKIGT